MKKAAEQKPWFKWIPAVATDVMTTWKRHGFVPPSEDPKYQRKWAEWKARFADAEAAEQQPPKMAAVATLRRAR